jgi:hypothetical protein
MVNVGLLTLFAYMQDAYQKFIESSEVKVTIIISVTF